MSKATFTVEGFVAKTPELGSHNGKSVTNVTVPHTPRRKNPQTGQFEDAGPTLWVQASFWGEDAEAVVATVGKGTLVTITGQPELNVYTKQDGSSDAQVRLKFATLGVIPRGVSQGRAGQPQTSPATDEPWGTPTGPQNAFQGGAGFGDNTPF